MKISPMTRRNRISLLAGSILLLGALLGTLAYGSDPQGTPAMLAGGLTLVIAALIRHMRFGPGVEHDERTKLIAYTGLAAAFQLSLMGIAILWWAEYVWTLPFSTSDTLSLVLFGMIALAILMQFYYARRPPRL